MFPRPKRLRKISEESKENRIRFDTNDYLGLSKNFEQYRPKSTISTWGASGSRLLGGNSEISCKLEYEIAKRLGTSAALLFSSGYLANVGILSSILTRNDFVFADKLCHASIIDGIRLSGARLIRFKHNDSKHLRSLLMAHRHLAKEALIITESLFSMDGDTPDLKEIIALKKEFECVLYVDDAHAIGVYDKDGYGLCKQYMPDIDIIVGGFGKALGSIGGYVGCSTEIKEFLVSSSRTFIYTTALPAPVLEWNYHIWTMLPSLEMERDKLHSLIGWFNQTFLPSKEIYSQIVPIICGSDKSTIELSNTLEKAGFSVPAIRPPSVPEKTSRLRLSLCAYHTKEELNGVMSIVQKYVSL